MVQGDVLSWVWRLIPEKCSICGEKLSKPIKLGYISFAQHKECYFDFWKSKDKIPAVPVYRRLKSPALKTANMDCLRSRFSLNLSDGCPHECVYCYARAMWPSPPHGSYFIRSGIVDRVKNFIKRSRVVKPVYASPVSDPLASPELAEMTLELSRFFVDENIPFYLVTKGEIPNRIFETVQNYPFFAVQVSLTTLDKSLAHLIEPNAPSSEVRLRNLRKAKDWGIFTVLREDPFLPLLTDSEQNITELTQEALDMEVDHIIGSFVGLKTSSPSHFEYLQLWFRENEIEELAEKYEELFFDKGRVFHGYRISWDKYRYPKLKLIRDLILESKKKTTYGLCLEDMDSLWIGDQCEGFRFAPVKRNREQKFVPIEGCEGNCRYCQIQCTSRSVQLKLT
ncbi:MAG: radical SAM protein [Candidatus Jordarchaeum sp.]|uniref:SPL family radical SAM protein n=1 Tax=Candidatus Jordarchaeum sp. TaxID=2823881 RepID=UPI00404B26B1